MLPDSNLSNNKTNNKKKIVVHVIFDTLTAVIASSIPRETVNALVVLVFGVTSGTIFT